MSSGKPLSGPALIIDNRPAAAGSCSGAGDHAPPRGPVRRLLSRRGLTRLISQGGVSAGQQIASGLSAAVLIPGHAGFADCPDSASSSVPGGS